MNRFTKEEQISIVRILQLIMQADSIINPKETAYLEEVREQFGINGQDLQTLEELSLSSCKECIGMMDLEKQTLCYDMFYKMAAIDGYSDPRERLVIMGLGNSSDSDMAAPLFKENDDTSDLVYGKDLALEFIGEHGAEDEPKWDHMKLLDLLFEEHKNFPEACDEFVLSYHKKFADTRNIWQDIRSKCLFLLEGSPFMVNAQESQRSQMQQRLTYLLELIESYVETHVIISQGISSIEINRTLKNLKSSGFLYQAERQMRKLVCIFSMKPQLMQNYMGALFHIIACGNKETWMKEPYCNSFSTIMELFIRRHSLSDINLTDISKENQATLDYLIQALAIQYLLNAKKDEKELSYDGALNRSRFYRYLSHLKAGNSKLLIDKAFIALRNASDERLEFTWDDIQNPDLIASKLSYSRDTLLQTKDSIFKGEKSSLLIRNQQILIKPNTIGSASCDVIPNGFFPWQSIQIQLNENLKSARINNRENLDALQEMWKDAELAIFTDKKAKASSKIKRKHEPQVGDAVLVWVKFQDEDNPDNLYCVIEEDDVQGEGWLNMHNLVSYNVRRVYVEDFKNSEGKPLLFEVKVDAIQSSGQCIFKGINYINEFMHDNFNYNEEYECFILSKNANFYYTITQNGFTLNLPVADAPHELNDGDFIKLRVYETKATGYNNGYYSGEATNGFDIHSAFKNLMLMYAYDALDVDKKVEKKQEEVLQPLSEHHVGEIMRLIDRMAVIESSYFVAYSYLAVARIIALILDDTQRAEYYKQRMRLIVMLQNFSTNNSVDSSKLAELENMNSELVANYPALNRQFIELKTVSYQGRDEHNEDLWNTIKRTSSKHIKELAGLSLAYNLLSNEAMPEILQTISERTRELLGIRNEGPEYKYYGKEDLHTEFKTSIVYPSNNNMHSDLKAQTMHIMERVCGFLNAEGGTLYIGVNNEGYTAGLTNDFKYPLFMKGNVQDNYDLYFGRQVCDKIGKEARSLLDTHFEVDNDRVVYVVCIKPSPHVQDIQGRVFQRQLTENSELKGEDLRKFRELKQVEMLKAAKTSEAQKTAEEEKPVPIVSAPEMASPKGTIKTSAHRNNVLHDGEMQGEQEYRSDIISYFHFLPNGEYYRTEGGYGEEEDMLVLAVHEDEAEGCLVLVYENGNVVKVDMAQLLKNKEWQHYQRYNETNLIFACPARPNDAIITASVDRQNRKVIRVDSLNTINSQRITAKGATLMDVDVKRNCLYDIIPSEFTHAFEKVSTTARTSAGLPLKSIKELGLHAALQVLKIEI